MNPRDKFWNMFTAIKHDEVYYQCYKNHVQKLTIVISTFCLIFSLSSIAAWGIWNDFHMLWVILISIAQVLSTINPLLPFSKQFISLKFLVPSVQSIFCDMAYDWDKIDQYNNDEIITLLASYRKRYNEVENQFIGDVYFPPHKRCSKAAEIECKNYFEHFYNMKINKEVKA